WLATYRAVENDRRKVEGLPPVEKLDDEKVLVWPDLVYTEMICMIALSALLIFWAIWLQAPLEEPANSAETPNPSKAPWYFLGLQEMLVYFDPWIAGVVMPTLMIFGLMAFPYVDSNPLGVGYYTWKQRKVAIGAFLVGFGTWIILIFIGTFIRGPGWVWFWPGETWDHNYVPYEVNRDLPDIVASWGLTFIGTQPWKGLFGAIVVGLFFAIAGFLTHKMIVFSSFEKKIFERTSMLQYVTFQFFAITILWALPAKLLARLLFRIKYVMVTPWFNI
ncbi:MAG TPA: cytochrome C, partial [Blastocatellia bacterium]|nr:cytochrome C [Blastocatellia bacterium]